MHLCPSTVQSCSNMRTAGKLSDVSCLTRNNYGSIILLYTYSIFHGEPLYVSEHCGAVKMPVPRRATMTTDASTATPKVLFSDLDGTLVHYPKDFNAYASLVWETAERALVRYSTGEERECVILSSLTGGKAYISTKTITLIAELRSLGLIFVIITGARTSTYLRRRALLPPADYELFENGGRLFRAGKLVPEWTDRFSSAIGPIADRDALQPALPPPEERAGELWKCYSELATDGWHLDARDYVTNFRIKTGGETSDSRFLEKIAPTLSARALTSSFNLGKADVYPAASGKANGARHVLEECGIKPAEAVAMFDDDNDLQLGALCGRSFLPGVTHPSVLEALRRNPTWVLTEQRGFLGTEAALQAIMRLFKTST